MPRTKIELPAHFNFTTEIPVRITDINYGGHVGNDSILSLIHEARMQFLQAAGLNELGLQGPGMIMRDVTIEFRKEVFYGDRLLVSVTATEIETASFELVYKFERNAEKKEIVAAGKTGMVCYDYQRKKVTVIPPEMRSKLAWHPIDL